MFFGMTSPLMSSLSWWRLHLFLRAIATARFASFWPTIYWLSCSTTSRGLSASDRCEGFVNCWQILSVVDNKKLIDFNFTTREIQGGFSPRQDSEPPLVPAALWRKSALSLGVFSPLKESPGVPSSWSSWSCLCTFYLSSTSLPGVKSTLKILEN